MKLVGGSVLGLICLAGAARAELILSGSTAGEFTGGSGGVTDIVNAPDGSSASFLTGVPVAGSFQSGVLFQSTDFSGIADGDTFGFGLLQYQNGRTRIGTSSANAVFDFYLNLDIPDFGPLLLTTITFGIDATVNTPNNPHPDMFTATFTQPPAVRIGDTWVKFTINDLPAESAVAEGGFLELAQVTVTYFTAVPEPSTYGLIGAAALVGVVALRRYRNGRRSELLGAAA